MNYEELVERGRMALATKEDQQWALGEIVATLKRAARLAGDDSDKPQAVREWAADVGISRSSAYEYADMWEFYPAEVRERWPATTTYNKARIAMRASATPQDALELLTLMNDKHWTIEKAAYELQRKRAKYRRRVWGGQVIAAAGKLIPVNGEKAKLVEGMYYEASIYETVIETAAAEGCIAA